MSWPDALGAFLAAVAPPDKVETWPEVEALIFNETNSARRRERRTPFIWDARAAAAARLHTEDMLRRRYFKHQSPDGRSVGDRLKRAGAKWTRCAENLYGQPTLSRFGEKEMRAFGHAAVGAWLKSKGHRQNVLAPTLARLGVGVVSNDGNVIAVQVFFT